MLLRKPTLIFIAILTLAFQSCDQNKATKTETTTTKTENTVSANQQFLEDDGITLVLPDNFERYSSAEYQAVLKTLVEGKQLDLEEKRLRHLRNIDGNHYIYYDKSSKSTILINSLPYAPIPRENAKSILADITRDLTESSKITKLDFEKVTAKFSSTPSTQIFKSIYKISDKKKKKPTRYEHKYYLAFSNDKNLNIDINTTLDIDFDTYLEKIKR